MPRPWIEDLDWDDENIAHFARHGLEAEVVARMIERDDWVEVGNKRLHPVHRLRLVGRDRGGAMVTVIVEPTALAGIWRPITGWWSTRGEATLYWKRRSG